MKTLTQRLDYLGRITNVLMGPLLILIAVSLGKSHLMTWGAGVIIVLISVNKLHMIIVRQKWNVR